MHTNNKINLLIRASRLYCRPKYLEFNSGYYPQIEYIIRGLSIRYSVQNPWKEW